MGGKTAVNHPLGKNMIGAFYQPRRVIIDPLVLGTLEPRQFSAGMAEVIKYGLIREPGFFSWLEAHVDALMAQDKDSLEYAIQHACLCKAKVVEEDEREGGVRALLNLGHTFGHAIETATGYGSWLHGEAVGLGMVMAGYMSREMAMLDDGDLARTEAVLKAAHLNTAASEQFGADQIHDLMSLDKKVESGEIRLVLLRQIGDAYLTSDYSDRALRKTLEHYCLG